MISTRHLLLPLAALSALLFAAQMAVSKVKHCPFAYQMQNGALCKQFSSTRGNRVFTDCSYGREYVNPETFSPVEVCQ